MIALADHKLQDPFWTAFIKAIFAGWLMTMLTWLLVAAVGSRARLAIIWTMAALIVLAQFNHGVISAVEIFIAMFFGAPITFGLWLTSNFVPALAGNLLGGGVSVTLLTYVQARDLRPSSRPRDCSQSRSLSPGPSSHHDLAAVGSKRPSQGPLSRQAPILGTRE